MAETKKERPIVVPSAVRRWARAQGMKLGSRGRLPDDVVRAYRQARQAARNSN